MKQAGGMLALLVPLLAFLLLSPPQAAAADGEKAVRPSAPSNPGSTALATNSITWTWQDNSSDETGFKVWANSGTKTPGTLRTTTAANATSWKHSGLAVNAVYSFQAAATGAGGDSAKTALYSIYTLAKTPFPPVVTSPTRHTLNVAIAAGDGNPATTTYVLAVAPTVGGNTWIQANGTVGATAVWRTAAQWATTTVTGLAADTLYTFRTKARNGNNVQTAYPQTTSMRTLEETPPTGTVVVNNDDTFATSTAVTLTLSASDGPSGSGVTEMRVGQGGAWSAWEPYATTRSFVMDSVQGVAVVQAQFRDAAGNESDSAGDAIFLDSLPPTGTMQIGEVNGYATSLEVTIALVTDDGAGSGVSSMRFSEDGAVWTDWEPLRNPADYSFTGYDGSRTLHSQVRDAAGNVNVLEMSDSVIIDATAPNGAVVINNNAYYTTAQLVTLELSAFDGTSGVADYRFSDNGTDWSLWAPLQTLVVYNLPYGDGLHTVYVQYRDRVGHVSEVASDSIHLDLNAPTATVTRSASSPTTNTVLGYAVQFSEPVAHTFDASDVSLTGGLAGSVQVGGADPDYTVTVTLTSSPPDGTSGIRIGTGVADPAGNAFAGASSAQYEVVYWPGFANPPHDILAYSGDSFSLDATPAAGGVREPYYAWRFENLQGMRYNGPPWAVWTENDISASRAGTYQCTVNYGGLAFRTPLISVQVQDPLSLVTGPQGGRVPAGSAHSFSVSVTGGYPPLAFHWKKDGAYIDGATASELTIDAVTKEDEGFYSVEINDHNLDSIESAPVELALVEGLPAAGPGGLALLAALLSALTLRRERRGRRRS